MKCKSRYDAKKSLHTEKIAIDLFRSIYSNFTTDWKCKMLHFKMQRYKFWILKKIQAENCLKN